MKILFDTNIVLDVLLDREPFAKAAFALMEEVELGVIQGYLCATTITTIYYLAAKALGRTEAQVQTGKLLSLFEVAPVSRAVLEAALRGGVLDFEDAVLAEAAKALGADGIVTRNLEDFKMASIGLYSPKELNAIIESSTP